MILRQQSPRRTGLVHRVMRARGYPTGDFEQEAADVSVDHPEVVSNYRAAHEIAMRAREDQSTTTETLRQGLVYYRLLFEDCWKLTKRHVIGGETMRADPRETPVSGRIDPRPKDTPKGIPHAICALSGASPIRRPEVATSPSVDRSLFRCCLKKPRANFAPVGK